MIAAGLELFRANFYRIDFFIGVMTPVAVFLLYRRRSIDRFVWRLFWMGFALGLTWEVPMQVLNALGPDLAVHSYTRPPAVHFSAIILLHSFWDGGLFLLGVGLIHWICGAPAFARFKPCELLVLLVWGQASELWVELTSLLGEAWAYIPRPWNPSLFKFHGQNITLMPQLIWLGASIVFYLIALKAKRTN